jgi:hypothetical protein
MALVQHLSLWLVLLHKQSTPPQVQDQPHSKSQQAPQDYRQQCLLWEHVCPCEGSRHQERVCHQQGRQAELQTRANMAQACTQWVWRLTIL